MENYTDPEPEQVQLDETDPPTETVPPAPTDPRKPPEQQ